MLPAESLVAGAETPRRTGGAPAVGISRSTNRRRVELPGRRRRRLVVGALSETSDFPKSQKQTVEPRDDSSGCCYAGLNTIFFVFLPSVILTEDKPFWCSYRERSISSASSGRGGVGSLGLFGRFFLCSTATT